MDGADAVGDEKTVPPAAEPVVWKPEAHLGWLMPGGMTPLWLEQLGESDKAQVVIDLSEVVGIDSRSLDSLVDLVAAALGDGASKVTVQVSTEQVVNLLRLVSLDLLCEIKLRDREGQPAVA